MLIVFSGLPGSGKSTLSSALAQRLRIPLLGVDDADAALDHASLTGYLVIQSIAARQLRLGLDVIVDAVNPVQPARDAWRTLAGRFGAQLVHVEVVCSDPELHRQRVLARGTSWERVLERQAEYEPWREERIVVDTATASVPDLAERLERDLRVLVDREVEVPLPRE